MRQLGTTFALSAIILASAILLAQAEPLRRSRPVCESGPEKDAVSELRARDPRAEAAGAAALNDFQLMGYRIANVAGLSTRAVGSGCGPRPRKFRAVLGFDANINTACMLDYQDAAMAFVQAYNDAISRHAHAQGIDPCDLP
jgi:hypothetical protein